MDNEKLITFLKNILIKAATFFPSDIEEKIEETAEREEGIAGEILKEIKQNILIARKKQVPICQDTGVINFFIKIPFSFSKENFKKIAFLAVKDLIQDGTFRFNSTQALKNADLLYFKEDEIKYGAIFNFDFTEWDRNEIEVEVLLKGGGSENVSGQFSLPDLVLDAGRNEEGVMKCALEIVKKAGGKGCPPGILGISVGGDRASGYFYAKKQLLRKVDEKVDLKIKNLEKEITERCNLLGIGPGGMGGKNTVLYSKLCFLPRHPACFYVTVSYNCWALRRAGGSITLK